jgi:hypothetical protein
MEAENLSRMMVSFCLQRSGNLHSAGNEIPYEIETGRGWYRFSAFPDSPMMAASSCTGEREGRPTDRWRWVGGSGGISLLW